MAILRIEEHIFSWGFLIVNQFSEGLHQLIGNRISFVIVDTIAACHTKQSLSFDYFKQD